MGGKCKWQNNMQKFIVLFVIYTKYNTPYNNTYNTLSILSASLIIACHRNEILWKNYNVNVGKIVGEFFRKGKNSKIPRKYLLIKYQWQNIYTKYGEKLFDCSA